MPPIGLCASGLIDIFSIMKELCIIDTTGLIAKESVKYSDYLCYINEEIAFKIPGCDV